MQTLRSCIKIRALPKTMDLQSTLQRCTQKRHEDASWLAPPTALLLGAGSCRVLDKHYDSGPALDEQSLSPLPHRPRPRGHLREDAENRKASGWGRAGQVVFWTRRGQGVHELTAVEISRRIHVRRPPKNT